ncbi:MAG: hypothetical protein K2P17_00465 [Helicobacteraceae bacterium]|nr:hypothetical protein [Helicobacteraceae bacterium]
MKKIVILFGIALLIGISIAVFYYKNSEFNTNVLKDYELDKLACNLIKNPCKIEFKGGEVTFDIAPRPVVVMDKSTITISNLKYNISDPKIRIYGLNMDMGTIIASLDKIDSSTYQAVIALSACLIEDVMRYRISIYDGNEELKLFTDFDLER